MDATLERPLLEISPPGRDPPPSGGAHVNHSRVSEAAVLAFPVPVDHLPPRGRLVRMNLNPSQVANFRTLYGIEPITTRATKTPTHPHLAFERSALEENAIKIMQKGLDAYNFSHPKKAILVDIGSAPSRVLKQSTDIHCLVPILQPGDLDRSAWFSQNPRVCSHNLFEHLSPLIQCPCHEPVYAYLATHSVYYLQVDEIVEALRRSVGNAMYVVTHEFIGASGGFSGEAEWHRIAPDRVQMRVHGNKHHYQHPIPPWQGNGEVNLGSGVVLEASLVETMGVTNLHRLSLVRRPALPTQTGDWDTILVDRNHAGPIHIPSHVMGVVQSNVSTNGTIIGWNSLYGDGDFLYSTGFHDRFVILPRGAVAEVATHIALLPRDAALLRNAKHKAKHIIDAAPIPIEMKPLAITLVAVLAMCINVVNETAILQTAVSNYSGYWRAHARVTQLLPLPTWSYWHMVAFFVLCGFGFVVAGASYPHDPTPHHVLALVVLLACLTAGVLGCCGRFFYERIHLSASNVWSDTRREENRSTDVAVPIYPTQNNYIGSTNLAPPNFPDLEYESPTDIEIGPDPRPSNGNPPVRLIHSGIAPASFSVNVVEPNQAAELSGITNRMMQPDRPIDPDILRAYERVFDEAPEMVRLKTIEVDDSDDQFEHWVVKYPPERRNELRMAREEARAKGTITVSTKGKAFTKLEKGNKIDRSGEAKTKPRMIVSFDDQLTACSGPFVVDYSNQVGQLWSEQPSRVMYARGMTAEAVGKRIGDFFKSCGGVDRVRYLVLDYSSFDGSTSEPILRPPNQLMMSSIKNPVTRKALAIRPTKVKSSHGIRVRARAQINSGKGDTNLVGTEINVGAALVWMNQVPEARYLGCFMGDDNTTIVDADHLDEDRVESMRQIATGLGLVADAQYRTRLCDFEFCSKLLYPVGDAYILGCKPGRVIRRLGYNLTAAGAANLRGAAISLVQCCNFIPFLRPYLLRILELTAGSKVKRDKHAEEWIFHTETLHVATHETYLFMTDRYGLTKEDELVWEDQLSKITSLPCVVSNPSIDIMIARDEQ